MTEQTLSFSAMSEFEGVYEHMSQTILLPLTIGESYTVVWDGTKYNCVAGDGGSGMVALGNIAFMLGEGDTGEPFLFGSDGTSVSLFLAINDSSETHTIEIYKSQSNVIVLYDRTGKAVTYSNVETLSTDTNEEGVKATFTRGVLMDGAEVELDMATGDQEFSVPSGYLFKKAVIKKPETLLPENIKKDVEIAGVLGEFGGEEKEVTVELSMRDGDQVIEAEEGTVFKKVTIEKPKELKPWNIVEGANIGGIDGTMPFEFSNDKKIVIFYDYDGTVVDAYHLEPDEVVTELPEPPQHDGLIFAGWNHSIKSINENKIGLDVGAMYYTDDGATRLYMDLPYENFPLYLNFYQSIPNGVTIDWGDGITEKSGETTDYVEVSHIYENKGKYVIRLFVEEGCTFYLSNTNKKSGYASGLFSDANNNFEASRYLLKAEIGNHVSKIETSCFNNATSMQTITIPPNTDMGSCFESSGVMFIVFPTGCTRANSGYVYYVKGYSVSETTETAYLNVINGMKYNHIIIPKNVKTSSVSIMGSTGYVDCVVLGSGLENHIGSIQFAKKIWSFSDKIDILQKMSTGSTTPNFVEEIYMPESSTQKITNKGLYYAHSLKKCVIPKSVTEFSDEACMYARIWEDGIPDDNNVKSIGKRAFYETGIRRLVLPRIRTMAEIYNCYNLSKLKLSNKITELNGIRNCFNLKEFTIPHGITTLKSSTFGDSFKTPNVTILGDNMTFESSSFRALTSIAPYVIDWLDVFCRTEIASIASDAFKYASVRNLIIRKADAFLAKANSLISYSGANTVYVPAALYDSYLSYCSGKTLKKIEDNYDLCGQEADIVCDEEQQMYVDYSQNYYTLITNIDYVGTEEAIDTGKCCCYSPLDKTRFSRITKVEVK